MVVDGDFVAAEIIAGSGIWVGSSCSPGKFRGDNIINHTLMARVTALYQRNKRETVFFRTKPQNPEREETEHKPQISLSPLSSLLSPLSLSHSDYNLQSCKQPFQNSSKLQKSRNPRLLLKNNCCFLYTQMAGREVEMESNEILDNVGEDGDHHLVRANPESVNVTHEEEMRRLEERLRGIDWFRQFNEQTEPDCAIGPANASCSMDVSLEGDMPPQQGIQHSEPTSVIENVEADSDHHLERENLEVEDWTNDKEIHRLEDILGRSDFWGEAESEFRQFNDQTEPGYTLGPAHASSSADVPLLADQGRQQLDPATVAPEIIENRGVDGHFFLKLQEASNICKAAYKEIMTKALEAKTFVESSPALGSLDEMFSSPPPCGMRVDCSIETAIIPVGPNILASMMMDVDKWDLDDVSRGSCHDPTGVLKLLKANDNNILEVKMVTAEVRLPTPLVPTRKFCFLRFQRQIIPNIWAIVDVSDGYFLDNPDGSIPKGMCRRRPSGVIIRAREKNSEVIWIENVEVYECQLENNIYSTVLNSNLAFCAKHWVTTLSQKMHRNDSKYYRCNMQANQGARTYLLELCAHMKKIFLESAHEYPDENKFTVLSDEEGIRILKTTLDLDSYVGLTSFHVKAKLIPTFAYLIRRDIELEWPNLQNQEEPEQIIKLASEDASNCITVYRRLVSEHDSPKVFELIVQEISRNDFCSYVISSPMNPGDIYNSLCLGERNPILIQPSGFAIMPDGSRGLQSDASLVTVVAHKQLDVAEADRAIDIMTDAVTATMGDIEEAGSIFIKTITRKFEMEASSSKMVPNQPLIENANNRELVVRDNICNAALLKVMQKANSLPDWKLPVLPWGSLNNLVHMFEMPESGITRVECSVERVYLPTTKPDILVSMMMDQDQWLNPMSQIIKLGNSNKVDQGADLSIQNLQMVNAEFWLPTPFVETRRFRFMRFLKVLPCPGVMAIIDVSDDFLAHELHPLDPNDGPQCRRLPSGLLIRRQEKGSELCWIENVEVLKQNEHDEKYSTASESNWPFGAKRWVNLLTWIFRRKHGLFEILKNPENKEVFSDYLPEFALHMKKKFLSYVEKASKDEIKVLTSGDQETCVLVQSLSLQTEPCRCLSILSQKILQLQEMEIVDELCRFTDSQNTIAVYMVQNEQSNAYVVQEVSTDAYCSFIISAPITKKEYDYAQLPRYMDLRPSGLVITPGGAAGIKSDTSLLTFALQVDVDPADPDLVQDDKLAQRSTAIEKQIHALVR